ncbi:MAG: hypothetical protein II844_00305 [Prevotella sp.]|nr:hypothetical protein [Prevotella sp.]
MKQIAKTIKSEYRRPTIDTVSLQCLMQMLQSSPVSTSSKINDWEDGGTEEDEIIEVFI